MLAAGGLFSFKWAMLDAEVLGIPNKGALVSGVVQLAAAALALN